MAFVIVQHLDPHHGSRLPNLLGKATSMPVTEVTETTTPQPNSVYVQPPNKCLRSNIDVPDLDNILRDVIETLGTRERRVTDKEGRRYSLRVRPYRTTDNKIDGAVITLVDLDGEKEADAVKTSRRTKDASSRK